MGDQFDPSFSDEPTEGDFRDYIVTATITQNATLQWVCEGDDTHPPHEDSHTFLEARFILQGGQADVAVLLPPQAVIGLMSAMAGYFNVYFPTTMHGPINMPDNLNDLGWDENHD